LPKQYQSNQKPKNRTRINHAIRARELRVIGANGENLGIKLLQEALDAAEAVGLDLIEISPNATPPVAKIMDFGKYRYETSRKAREIKAKSHVTETKSVQVKIGTGEHDQQLKAKRVANWLEEGHRVRVDLFLWGRYKYMGEDFLKERLQRFLRVIPSDYKIADEIKKGPKGLTATLERAPGSRPILRSQPRNSPVSGGGAGVKKTAQANAAEGQKSKRKSLDELMELGMI
jgi:translation initiation factor IF-3